MRSPLIMTDVNQTRGMTFRIRLPLFCLAALLTAVDVSANADCVQRCQQEARNNRYTDEGEHFCKVSCRLAENPNDLYQDLHTYQDRPRSQQWNPEHPVVQRCFREFGYADQFLDVSNQATNNCIVEGLAAERAAAPPIPRPRPRPPEEDVAKAHEAPAGPQQPAGPDASLNASQNSCASRYESVKSSCDAATHRRLEQTAQQQAQAPQANGTAAACGQAHQQSQDLNAALRDFQRQCDSAVESCVSSCNQTVQQARQSGPGGNLHPQVQSILSEASAYSELCSRMRVKVSMVEEQRKSAFQSSMEAAGCAAASAATALAGAQRPNAQAAAAVDCTKTPDAPQCAGSKNDCSDPKVAASDPVCICHNNPSACGSQSAASARESLAALPGTPIRNNGSNSFGSELSGDGQQGPIAGSNTMNMGPSGRGPAFGGSSGPGVDLDGRPLNSPDTDPTQGPTLSADIHRGGAPGGRPAMRLPSRGSSFDSSAYRSPPRAGRNSQGVTGPDLQGFRPNLRRSMAGAHPRDGITGPHSDNWKKVQSRYHFLSDTLEP